jgi:hypothetical protein
MKLKDDMMYDDWEFDLRAELRRRGVLAVASGAELRPLGSENSKAVKAWVTKRDVATATIIARLDPSQFAHVRDFEEDPVGMWERLKETHQSSGLGGVVAMWRKFYSIRKPLESSTMRPHIAAVRGLAEKLGRIYNDKPSDAQIIATLLMSLPPAYDSLLVTLDSHADKDDLGFVVGRLLNEEARQESDLSIVPFPESTSAMTARTFRDKSRITCYRCGKLGHYRNECPLVATDAAEGATAAPTTAAYVNTYAF